MGEHDAAFAALAALVKEGVDSDAAEELLDAAYAALRPWEDPQPFIDALSEALGGDFEVRIETAPDILAEQQLAPGEKLLIAEPAVTEGELTKPSIDDLKAILEQTLMMVIREGGYELREAADESMISLIESGMISFGPDTADGCSDDLTQAGWALMENAVQSILDELHDVSMFLRQFANTAKHRHLLQMVTEQMAEPLKGDSTDADRLSSVSLCLRALAVDLDLDWAETIIAARVVRRAFTQAKTGSSPA